MLITYNKYKIIQAQQTLNGVIDLHLDCKVLIPRTIRTRTNSK